MGRKKIFLLVAISDSRLKALFVKPAGLGPLVESWSCIWASWGGCRFHGQIPITLACNWY